jgi:multidrug efflux pump subunit AcrA (membrane-fusion protein)
MKLNKIILIVLGIVIIGLGFFGMKSIIASKHSASISIPKNITKVYVQKVENKSLETDFSSSGVVSALNKIELYSEVGGIATIGKRDFRLGQRFNKGEVILRIDNREQRANLLANRSSFEALLSSILPDILLDYSAESIKWESYLNKLDIGEMLPDLPQVESKQLKNYLSSKKVFSTFYSVKNLEVRLSKFELLAPFSGVLSIANIRVGTLVRPGQNLGEFLSPNNYEITLDLPSNYLSFLRIGKRIELNSKDINSPVSAKIVRINPQINPQTQMIKIVASFNSEKIKDGMYLDANVKGSEIDSVVEISRSLIAEGDIIYKVEGDELVAKKINIAHTKAKTAFVFGLTDGDVIISKPVIGSHHGMKVEIVK